MGFYQHADATLMATEPTLVRLAAEIAPVVKAESGRWASAARWARAIGILALVLVLCSTVYVFSFSGGVVEDTHRRNDNDLAVAARGLETWPADIGRLARTNLATDRLSPPPIADRVDGWDQSATLEHPDLGTLAIRYKLSDSAASCATGDQPASTPDTVGAFVRAPRAGSGQVFVVADSLRLSEIWASDMGDGRDMSLPGATDRAAKVMERLKLKPGAETVAQPIPLPEVQSIGFLRTAENGTASAIAPAKTPPDPVLCFRVAVPLDRLVALERTGKGFSHLLVTNAAGRIFASTGATELPVTTLAGLGGVESPMPRFSANSRRVRRVVSAWRTASSSNSCVKPF